MCCRFARSQLLISHVYVLDWFMSHPWYGKVAFSETFGDYGPSPRLQETFGDYGRSDNLY